MRSDRRPGSGAYEEQVLANDMMVRSSTRLPAERAS